MLNFRSAAAPPSAARARAAAACASRALAYPTRGEWPARGGRPPAARAPRWSQTDLSPLAAGVLSVSVAEIRARARARAAAITRARRQKGDPLPIRRIEPAARAGGGASRRTVVLPADAHPRPISGVYCVARPTTPPPPPPCRCCVPRRSRHLRRHLAPPPAAPQVLPDVGSALGCLASASSPSPSSRALGKSRSASGGRLDADPVVDGMHELPRAPPPPLP